MRSLRPLAVWLALTSLAGAADVSNRDFYNAIRQNDLAQLKQLITAGAGVNARSKIGRTPLMIAAGSPGSIESVRLLLSKGADPKAADFQGTTALVGAARVNDLDTMRLLLTQPIDINAGDFGGLTALIHAAGLRNLTAVKL